MVTQSWLHNFWFPSKKHDFHSQKENIAVLSFEAASLVTKLLHLWQSLVDKHVMKLRDEISNSEGVRKLVSEDENCIGRLICAEMTQNLLQVAKAVSRLSKKCEDPLVKTFEPTFNDLIKIGIDAYGWQYSWKKMDRKVKKLERFIIANNSLYQEMETLADLEQSLKRMKGSDNVDVIAMVEYEKKVACKRKEVKRLKEYSLWNRTYDYTILLLARSVFTVYSRIGHVFGINNIGAKENQVMDGYKNWQSHSTVFLQSSVYLSENCGHGFSGPILRPNKTVNFLSGPIKNSLVISSTNVGRQTALGFFSGPMGKPSNKSGPISRASKSTFRLWQFRGKSQDATGKMNPQEQWKGMAMSGPLLGRVMNRNSNSLVTDEASPVIAFNDNRLLNLLPETLGAAALALHYANVIIYIEKLVASPHLIGNDARDDLYNMLPASIRAELRAKLKPVAKMLTSSVYDTVLAAEWSEAISRTLEWLSPMAHNMVRWQSERSFEHQSFASRTKVLLVQTLYFANQEKTEAAITELLIGLNYIWRFGREINAKSLAECANGRTFEEYLD